MTPSTTSVQALSPETAELVRSVADEFAIEGEYVLGEEVESGHINSTYLATYQLPDGGQRRYSRQRINEKVFKDPLAVMRNVECVTSHINWKVLRKKRDLGGQTLSLYPHKTGRFYVVGEGGGTWRPQQQGRRGGAGPRGGGAGGEGSRRRSGDLSRWRR